jgi:hypothetical protein
MEKRAILSEAYSLQISKKSSSEAADQLPQNSV